MSSEPFSQTVAPLVPPASPEVRESQFLTLFEIATILATERELDAMMSKFLASLIQTLRTAAYGVLLLYDPKNDVLEPWASYGYPPGSLNRIRLSPGEGTCGLTFQAGEPQFFGTRERIEAARGNLSPVNRDIFDKAIQDLKYPQSSICLPLVTGQEAIGVLMLESLKRPNDFTETDLPFLQAVSGLMALAIENELLKEELRVTEALREANRLKTELISTLAHEMRTPLTSIKGYSTALLMEEASFGPETQLEFLQIIDDECDTLQDLIHDLLESSIIDSGLLRLEPQPVRLPQVTQEVARDMMRRSYRHRILVDFADDFPMVEADPVRIAQVLRNLIDNAIKYSPDGGLIVVRGEIGDHEAILSVADQGVGLAPEHVNRLFEIGFRVKSGLIRHVAGSGLGLPICQTIIESHGGRIWAESELGRGTTLYFTLPLTSVGPFYQAGI
jgi:signal transduction histidine kinase